MDKFDKDFWTRNLMTQGWQLLSAVWSFQKRGCQRRFWGCLLLMLLLILLACGLLFLVVDSLSAGSLSAAGLSAASLQDAESLHVFLLIDNSNSMFEKDGLGSDPGLLRIDAARLFITYLGVDNGRFTHECGVIFFGTQPETIVPLTPLNDDQRRADILSKIQQPQRMGWTDQIAVLAHVQQELVGASGQPVLVMLTDGKPEWGYEPSLAERDAYVAALQQAATDLAAAEIPVFIILLSNDATTPDPEITQIWEPVWQEMTQATLPGRYFRAREPTDLVNIYHEIVVALTETQTAGPVLQGSVNSDDFREIIAVEPDLARLTLVVSKSDPEIAVKILRPDGRFLNDKLPGVYHTDSAALSLEEVWTIEEPIPGEWTVIVNGSGEVTIWKDYLPVPAPLASATSPELVITPASTAPVQTATTAPRIALLATQESQIPFAAQFNEDATAVSPTQIPIRSMPHPHLATTPTRTNYSPLWPWLVGGGSIICLMAFVIYRQRTKHKPIISGVLVVVSGPGLAGFDGRVTLDHYHKSRLTIGETPADIVVMACSGRGTLTATTLQNGRTDITLTASKDVLLNQLPLTTSTPLYDTDTITFGTTRLRYENLRQRRPQEQFSRSASQPISLIN